MSHWKNVTVALGLVGAVFLPTASAQERPLDDASFVYEAKVVCKNVFTSNPADVSFDFGPHFMRTVLNLHNRLDQPARVRIEAIEATNIASGAIGASDATAITLRPNQAVFVACKDFRRLINKTDGAIRIDGYVRLTSSVPLTVDAVYNTLTRRPDGRSEGTSVDVERVRGRLIRQSPTTGVEPIDAP